MQNNTRSARRRAAIRTTALCCAVLIIAAIVTLWAQRTFWPEGVLARMLPYMALLYILLIPAMHQPAHQAAADRRRGGTRT